ncbi:DNA segregation ATPase FtsK/SpoIIIE, S-DNA-T family [Terribacillus halophilus]|uniref:DNA segregation ATPase FtsK/SpoIIIE, S-DNA-T family n=1 Tax=Terribacillus halophilus TaxID=361279 RepID=A0A1G6WXQ4_9BACI|nr:DNA translocase FtsK [Terribacillus halophilus]SDD69775.1 DNA segregation ATPase FtsK/SpoIIIE, S-DNA-T family [Terribacillus halophilus]
MWERLKQALSNFFMTEVVVEEEPELKSRNASEKNVQKQYQNNQQPQAKMAYTYPKERAFRFPMIPDESGSEKPPAPDVRPVRRQAQVQPESQPHVTPREKRQTSPNQREKTRSMERSPSQNQPRQPQRPRPAPKEDKKPFQPSEVPSPVYGFRKRKEEEAAVNTVTLESIQERADWKKIAATVSDKTQQEHVNLEISAAENIGRQPETEVIKESAEMLENIHSAPEKEIDSGKAAYTAEPTQEQDSVSFKPESVHMEQKTPAPVKMEEDTAVVEDEKELPAEGQEQINSVSPQSESVHMEQKTPAPVKMEEDTAVVEDEKELPAEGQEQINSVSPQSESVHMEQKTPAPVKMEEDTAVVEDEKELPAEGQEQINSVSPQSESVHMEQKTPHPGQVEELDEIPTVLEQEVENELHAEEEEEWKQSSIAEQEIMQPGVQEEQATVSGASREAASSGIREASNAVRKPVPFNVFMTPRDKRNHLEKIKNPAPQVMEEPAEELNVQTEPNFTSPPMHLLNDPVEQTIENDAWVDQQIHLLETTLEHFNVNAHVVNAMQGPSVTRFEVQPEMGVKVSKIKSLTDDIKLNMAAKDIRMEAPIPGKNAIGIEVPNAVSKQVGLQEILETEDFQDNSSPLSVALGLNISGRSIVTDLQKMPHGLIAGATGSGKSVCINTILLSLLYKANHKQVKFLLIDPKMVELAPYNDLPHLVSPVITDTKAATAALKWAVNEMEERYMKFVGEGVRDIGRYNEKLSQQGRHADKLPYLVIVIDELADLMMVSPQDVEDAICRIAQKARAAGIHLLLATQRPSVDVITGLIKANIPTRIAFSVSSAVDSRTIIDNNGAEKLLGKGDMLFIENGARQAQRIQGAFVSDEEIERVVEHVKQTAPPEYLFQHEDLLERRESEEEEDELYREAVEFVIEHNSASASLLQRRFKIGYNRAARLIDHMEMRGVISEQKGSKPRDVLVSLAQLQAE